MKVLIIEDEENSRVALINLIKNFGKDIDKILSADSVSSATEVILKEKPEILILDIELSDGVSFSILKNIPPYKYALFFITAYNQYAQKAIKHSALDYILKPYNPVEVINALEKAKHEIEENSLKQKIKILLENQSSLSKIALPCSSGVIIKPIEDIMYIESNNNYSLFYFNNGDQVLVTKTLKYYEETLDSDTFTRIHQSFLVNINYIEEYSKLDGGSVKIKGKNIPVSRRKKDELEKIIAHKFTR